MATFQIEYERPPEAAKPVEPRNPSRLSNPPKTQSTKPRYANQTNGPRSGTYMFPDSFTNWCNQNSIIKVAFIHFPLLCLSRRLPDTSPRFNSMEAPTLINVAGLLSDFARDATLIICRGSTPRVPRRHPQHHPRSLQPHPPAHPGMRNVWMPFLIETNY